MPSVRKRQACKTVFHLCRTILRFRSCACIIPSSRAWLRLLLAFTERRFLWPGRWLLRFRLIGSLALLSATAAADTVETGLSREMRLLLTDQQEFFQRLESERMAPESAEAQRVATSLSEAWERILAANPEATEAWILYGKFLRRIGAVDLANKAFVRANELDPSIAVVKQQIGNYLAETGKFELALAYFMAATELEPEEAVYHYQTGELIALFREEFIASGTLDEKAIDSLMLDAFATAARLRPEERSLQLRYAEAWFDVADPEWPRALELWKALHSSATNPAQEEAARIRLAEVNARLGYIEKARELANRPFTVMPEANRHRLIELLEKLDASQ